MWWELVQATFLFGLVLLLAWLSTRLVGQRMSVASRGRMVRVLEHLPAGRDRSILLLEVGGRLYLVGSTGEQFNLLDAIDDPDTIARVLAQAPTPQVNPVEAMLPDSFRQVLDRVRGRQQPEEAAQLEQPVPGEEVQRLQEQLERLRRLQEKK